VKDNVNAIMMLIESNQKNETYNIACQNHIKNIDVVKEILSWYNATEDEIQFVDNRWGQDICYNIDNSKILGLGWTPEHPEGIYKWF